jgi:hypothetical protein
MCKSAHESVAAHMWAVESAQAEALAVQRQAQV